MLYEEFREGTGCRDNQYNYKVYKDLEIIYMNSDITKNEIYEYGKKLVNNDLTDRQKEWNREMMEKIDELREELEEAQAVLERNERDLVYWKNAGEEYKDMVGYRKSDIKYYKREIIRIKGEIKRHKMCLYK